jgi:hypothetical protein
MQRVSEISTLILTDNTVVPSNKFGIRVGCDRFYHVS